MMTWQASAMKIEAIDNYLGTYRTNTRTTVYVYGVVSTGSSTVDNALFLFLFA